MKLSDTAIGHISAAVAYIFFGFNILSCRAIATSGFFTPVDVFTLRSVGATLLFWIASAFLPKEKVDIKDFPKIFAASMLGFYLCQIVFLAAIEITTPFDCAIVASLTPIFTMIIAAIAIHEPITVKKCSGVLLSFIGVLTLIFNTTHSGGAIATQPKGILLMLCNGICFALYLGVFKPLITKYSVVTFMKWIFLFSTLMSLPFSASHLVSVDYTAIPSNIIGYLMFTIICATFMSYFLIPVAQQRIRPTLVSMYSYLQPMITAAVGIYVGMDSLTVLKVIAAILVFTGVAIVQTSRTAKS